MAALRGVPFLCVWLAVLPAMTQVRNEGAIPDGRGGISTLAIGAHHTCGIRQDGTADNYYGEATPLPGPFTELGAGYGHTCGLRGDGNRTATCTVTDQAGNTASGDASYRVVFGFNGYGSPVQNPGVLNVSKARQVVPSRCGGACSMRRTHR